MAVAIPAIIGSVWLGFEFPIPHAALAPLASAAATFLTLGYHKRTSPEGTYTTRDAADTDDVALRYRESPNSEPLKHSTPPRPKAAAEGKSPAPRSFAEQSLTGPSQEYRRKGDAVDWWENEAFDNGEATPERETNDDKLTLHSTHPVPPPRHRLAKEGRLLTSVIAAQAPRRTNTQCSGCGEARPMDALAKARCVVRTRLAS